MKKLLTLLTGALGLATVASAQIAPTGGPDSYGYTWRTSAAPNGPTYNFIDIRQRGTQVMGLDDDNSVPAVTIPFSFAFYTGSYNQIKVGSNGWVSFSSAVNNIAQPFATIPTADGANRNFLAPYLSDLNFSSAIAPNPGRCYYYANADSVIVTYENAPFWFRAPAGQADFQGSNTFQVIISRLDSSFTFQYQNMNTAIPAPTAGSPNQVVIGAEDITETTGLQAGLNMVPANNSAIKFYRPRNTSFQLTDVKPNWFNNPGNGGFFAVKNDNVDLIGNILNQGNRNVLTPFTVQARVQLAGGGPTTSRSISIPRLRAGVDTTVTFPQRLHARNRRRVPHHHAHLALGRPGAYQ